MTKDRKKPEDRQITFRLTSELHGRLEAAAEGLALDVSSLLRTMIREQLHVYEARVAEIEANEKRVVRPPSEGA